MASTDLTSVLCACFYKTLQTEEEGTDYHAKVFHHCTEVMKPVQVYNYTHIIIHSQFIFFINNRCLVCIQVSKSN